MLLTYRRGEAIIWENGNAIDRSSSHRERVQSRAIASDDPKIDRRDSLDPRREYARRDLGQDFGSRERRMGHPRSACDHRSGQASRGRVKGSVRPVRSLASSAAPVTHARAATGSLREGAAVIEQSTDSGVGGVAGASIVFCYFQHRKLAE